MDWLTLFHFLFKQKHEGAPGKLISIQAKRVVISRTTEQNFGRYIYVKISKLLRHQFSLGHVERDPKIDEVDLKVRVKDILLLLSKIYKNVTIVDICMS